MAATLRDVVSANLVLVGVGLLNDPDEVERFRNALDIDLRLEVGLVTNIPSGLTEPSRTLTLDRERIALSLSSSRSSIAREYPEQSDLARLAQIAALAISNTSWTAQTPQGFGYNIEMVFDQSSDQPAIRYIGERLFGLQSFGKGGWELSGGSGQLIFTDDGTQWTITIRPQPGDVATTRVLLALNSHQDERRLPNENEIRASLETAWNEAVSFMHRLDERRAS
jgi:hypothetical protein